MIDIKKINVEDTYLLRIKVLRNGLSERYRFDKDDDIDTFHLGAFQDNECLGIATFLKNGHSFFKNAKNVYQLRGMAVDNVFQTKGVGKLIIKKAIEILNESNSELLWCNAREHAIGFYKKMGFEVIGERFHVPNVGPHFVMYKYL